MVRLHCFSQSGNCFKVAFLLRALGQPWEPVFVDFMNGVTRTPGWREANNEMGEAPVLEDGTHRFTQSGLILSVLAERHGAFAGRTQEERWEAQRWILFDNHKFTSYFATLRFMKSFGASAPDPAVMAFLRPRVESAFGIVDRHLAKQAFMVGDAPTIADFSLCGYLFYPAEESGIDIAAQFPNLHAWTERLKQIPGWASPYEMLPGARIAPRW
ncbi:MAG: glutathione S-transferase [Rubrivivax sp.]